jgi:NADPH2:quinone reductase
MLAVVTGGPGEGGLRLAQVERARPASNEALVRVEATSLNRGEVKTALAAPAGWRPGWDFAGEVIEAAADGSGPAKGDRVVGMAAMAAWGEFVAAPTAALALVPDSVSSEDAATLPVAGLTARRALTKGPDKRARQVLVTGASGGVGQFAIQLAALRGDVVTAAVRTPTHETLVRGLGAQHVAVGDALGSSAPAARYDLILESVGGSVLGLALGLLAPGGTCVLLGASEGATTTFDASRFRIGGTSLYGLVMQHELAQEPPSVGLAELLDLMSMGALRSIIERRAPIEAIGDMAARLMAREFTGKAVLTFPPTRA